MSKSCAVVIFNFVDFDLHKKLKPRTSSLRDVERIEKIFFLFNIKIAKLINASLAEFKKSVEELSTFDFKEYKSILLIYMSHGDTENTIYCKDGQFNFLEESKQIFKNPTLRDKPKFITVQACKGSFDIDKNLYDSDNKSNISDDSQITAILMSSYEGFVSKRSDSKGSAFIEVFTDNLRKSWNKKPFIQILEDSRDQFNNIQFESVGTIQFYSIPADVNDKISNFTLN